MALGQSATAAFARGLEISGTDAVALGFGYGGVGYTALEGP